MNKAKRGKRKQREYYKLRLDSASMEAYSMLQTNLDVYGIDQKQQVILITSSLQAEGKSTTISNLGVAFAQSDKRVLIVDLDLRKPVQHRIFNVPSTTGVTTVLTGKSKIEDAIKPTDRDNLFLLPCGIRPPNPTELLRSEALRQLIEYLRTKYDIIILDTPPVLALADAAILSKYADSVLLVVSAGIVDMTSLELSIKNLNMVNANIIGVVMNNIKVGDHRNSYYYRYGYGYRYGND